MNDLVTVIMPTYNSQRFITESIESVLNQSYGMLQLIIVDDCSNDNTINVVNKYLKLDKRINLVKLEKNSGAGVARNMGLANHNSRYTAFIDSDDIWFPEKLDLQIMFMRENDAAIAHTAYEMIDEYGNSLNRIIDAPFIQDVNAYLKCTKIAMSTSIIDRDKIPDIKFRDIRIRQDANLWIDLLSQGHKAYGLNEVLAKYRVSPNQISGNKLKAAIEVFKLYTGHKSLTLPRAIYSFVNYAINATKKHF